VERVNKGDYLDKKVKERVLQYPETREQVYDQLHESAIREFCNHYISTGNLGYPTGTTEINYEFANTFRDELNLAMREYRYRVEFGDPPIEQPESVRGLFWKDDDPVLANLGV
jgi:hypothetical protein